MYNRILWELLILIIYIPGTSVFCQMAGGARDFVRIPLSDFFHKILVAPSLQVDSEKKEVIRARRSGVSLVGLICHIIMAIFIIIWASYFFGINLFNIPRTYFLLYMLIACNILIIVMGIYCLIISVFLIGSSTTADKKYKYHEKMKASSINMAATLRIKNASTGKRSKIIIQLPGNVVTACNELLIKDDNPWWVILENADSMTDYQYIATIGVLHLRMPYRIFKYAIDIEKGTSKLIRDYIENPEA